MNRIIVSGLIGIIIITTGIILVSNVSISENEFDVLTGTPADNYPEIEATIYSNKNTSLGEYKILLGSSLQDVSISKFVTVKIE